MNLTIEKIEIENFKGIKNLAITFDGPRTEISGGNATGKSSIYDAFVWLLFDKNAAGEKDFAIKRRQPDGEETHNRNVRVKGTFEIDGKALQLEKVYSEVWAKKRGEETQEYGGNTTDHYINGVPKKAGEYKSHISSMISEDKFKMITLAKHFNEGMGWQERRRLLFEMAGGDDEKSIAHSYSYKTGTDISAILRGATAEDAAKMYQSQTKKTNADMDNISVRIDELRRMEDADSPAKFTEEEIRTGIADIQTLIAAYDKQIVEKRNFQKEADTKIRNISNLKAKIAEREFELNNAGLQREITIKKLNEAIAAAEQSIERLESENKRKTGDISDKESELCELREKYKAETEAGFAIDENALLCQTCKQPLPGDMRTAGAAKLREDHEREKAKKLDANKRAAEYVKLDIEGTEKAIRRNGDTIDELLREIAQAKEKIAATHIEPLYAADTNTDPTISKLRETIEQLQAELDNIAVETADELIDQKAKLAARVTELNGELGRYAKTREARERIAELEQQQAELSEKLLGMQQSLQAVEDYIKFKCERISETVNSLFATAKFKLFKNLINGGMEEQCECLIDGVPYSDANSAAKTNAGLEIASALGRHFGFRAPIFIDNAESVNDIFGYGYTSSLPQMVRLSVSSSPELEIKGGSISGQTANSNKPLKNETKNIEGVA